MRRPYSPKCGEQKEFSDLLGPLTRFLRGCVGRRWDDVWSEICACGDSSSVTGRHLRDHVQREVTRKCRIVDGEVRDTSYDGASREVVGLYVHPEDDILRDAGGRRWARRDRDHIVLDGVAYTEEDGLLLGVNGIARKILEHGKREAVRIDGVWYWVIFAEVPQPQPKCADATGNQSVPVFHIVCNDMVTGREVRQGRYRAGKRQMPKRDLLRLGLRNGEAQQRQSGQPTGR